MADWQAIVKSVAPMIGTALGGPLGGMAVSAIGNALGLTDATQDSVKQAIMGMNPEQSLALKQADIGFKEFMAKLGYDNEQALQKIAADDRSSARAMQIASKSQIPGLLAVLITFGFFGILIGMLAGLLKTTDNQALLILLGALAAAWGAVVNYYYGSSKGSDEKTTILGEKLKAS